MTDQIKSLLKDKEIAKSTTDQTELEVSRLRIDIQRLSETIVSNKEEQAKLNSNVKSKIHEMNVLQKEMDALVVDRDRAITEHEQTRREYKATKEAFVDFKELMRYKAGV